MDHVIIQEGYGTLRALGRESLRGKWKFAFLATLVYYLALSVPTTLLTLIFGETSPIAPIYSLLVSGPFTLGYSIFILAVFRRQDAQVAHVFYGFEKFGKSLGLLIAMVLFIMLWSIPFTFSVGFYAARYLQPLYPNFDFVWTPFLFFCVLLVIPVVIACLRYSQAFFILIDNPDAGVFRCISMSKQMMKGNKVKYFLLQLTFIGWLIPTMAPSMLVSFTVDPYSSMYSVLTLIASLTTIFITPYLFTTMAAFYEILNGNLKAGTVQVTAEIVEEE